MTVYNLLVPVEMLEQELELELCVPCNKRVHTKGDRLVEVLEDYNNWLDKQDNMLLDNLQDMELVL